MSTHEKEILLAKWLDNVMTPQERSKFENLCMEDNEFAEQVASANQVAMMADQFEHTAVPQWDKNCTFDMPEKTKWWQWQGLPALSLSASAIAIVMVLTGVQVSVEDSRMTVGFAAKAPSQQEIAAMVDNKLNQYQLANQEMFGKYVDAIALQQKESAAQLTQYLLSSSRQERREDFAEFVKFINQQRDDDQRFMARQLNHLKNEIDALEGGYVMPSVSGE